MGILLIIALAVTLHYFEPLRSSLFDFYQSMYPRLRRSAPVVIIAIDEQSLRLHGQWPWPRTWLAQLLARVAVARPAAIGIDLVMPEPDRLSPGRLPEFVPAMGPDLAKRLAGLPSNDAVLAEALRGRPVVLGMAGLESRFAGSAREMPATHFGSFGIDPLPFVRRFKDALLNVEEIDAGAAGHGLLNVEPERGVVRRMSLVAGVGDRLLPAFGIEMLRVATRESVLTVHVGASGVEAVGIGKLRVPTESDGAVWLHFSRHDPSRFVSAADVLAGTANPGLFKRKLVLIGVTALGLSDYQATPVAERMSGVEIHAQLLEGIFDGALLTRPRYLVWIELGLLLLVGIAMLCVLDRAPIWVSVIIAATLVASLIGIPMGLFRNYGLLLDPIPAIIAVIALLGQQSLVKLDRLGRLKRFFSPQLARLIIEGGGGRPPQQSSMRSHGGLSRSARFHDVR